MGRVRSDRWAPSCTNDFQAGFPLPRFFNLGVCQPITVRMPLDGRDAAGPRRYSVHHIAGLGMVYFKARAQAFTTPRPHLFARADHVPSVPGPAETFDRPGTRVGHGPAAHPVGGIPEGYHGVGTSHGDEFPIGTV